MQKTILIIDDDAVIIALVNSILKDNGYHVISASNGQQGIDIACQSLPDLVLLDWNMPGMDGLEVLYALKNDELTTHIPVIMVPGTMTDHDNMLKAFENGVIDFVKKPFDRYELIARTYSILLLSEFYKEKLESKQKELVGTAMRLVEVNEFNMNLLKKIA